MKKCYLPYWLSGCLLLSSHQSLSADVYKYLDPSGQIHFTDQLMPDAYRLLKKFSASKILPDQKLTIKRRKVRYTQLIERAAQANGLESALVHAVVQVESAYQKNAVSQAGAMGLMQLMPNTAQILGVDDPFDPTQNLHGGSLYLRLLLTKFNDDLPLALAAYNAGENAVIRHGYKIPPYDETQDYVVKVMGIYTANLSDIR